MAGLSLLRRGIDLYNPYGNGSGGTLVASTPVERTTQGSRLALPKIVGAGARPGGRSQIAELPEDGNWLTPKAPTAPGTTTPAAPATNTKKAKTARDYGSYAADPILARAKADAMAMVRMRGAGALEEIKKQLLGFGSQQLARDTLARMRGVMRDPFSPFGQYAADTSGNPMFAFQYNGAVPEENKGGSWGIVATRPDGTVTAIGQGGERNGETITFSAGGFAPQALDPSLAGLDESFISAISDDPDRSMSTLAKLKRAFREAKGQQLEDLNDSNLFYSSERVNREKDLGYQQQSSTAEATSTLDQAISAALNGYLESQFQALSGIRSAEESAYERWLNRALALGMGNEDDGGDYLYGQGGTANPWTGITDLIGRDNRIAYEPPEGFIGATTGAPTMPVVKPPAKIPQVRAPAGAKTVVRRGR